MDEEDEEKNDDKDKESGGTKKRKLSEEAMNIAEKQVKENIGIEPSASLLR